MEDSTTEYKNVNLLEQLLAMIIAKLSPVETEESILATRIATLLAQIAAIMIVSL